MCSSTSCGQQIGCCKKSCLLSCVVCRQSSGGERSENIPSNTATGNWIILYIFHCHHSLPRPLLTHLCTHESTGLHWTPCRGALELGPLVGEAWGFPFLLDSWVDICENLNIRHVCFQVYCVSKKFTLSWEAFGVGRSHSSRGSKAKPLINQSSRHCPANKSWANQFEVFFSSLVST